MSSHTYHPDTHEFGLADGCPRCAEHAERPLDSLDSANLAALVERVRNEEEPRSANEAIAMRRVGAALAHADKLRKLRGLDV